jgi:hypothetical protein
MSASQYKSFCSCEAGALAEIDGDHIRDKTVALLVGSYVDSHFSKGLDLFKAQNPEIFLKGKPELKADYKHANYIIERIERDPMFMKYISGESQVVRTGSIQGVPFKIMMDSYHPGKAIVDLKVVCDFGRIWRDGLRLSFIEYWGYDTAAAIYQFIEGNNLPFFIAAATKEKEPDLAIISIPQERLDYCMDQVKQNVRRFADLKNGIGVPNRCERCDYCKSTKVIENIIDYAEVGE